MLYAVTCGNPECGQTFYGVPDEEECCICGFEEITSIPINECGDAGMIIEGIGMELENGNYHSFTDLPDSIFDVAKKYIKEEDQVQFAADLFECFRHF